MKTTFLRLTLSIAASINFLSLDIAWAEKTSNIQELLDTFTASERNKTTPDMADISTRFMRAIESQDFSASEATRKDLNGSIKIAKKLLESLKDGKPKADTTEAKALAALDAFLTKVLQNIDEAWEFKRVPINTFPPPGTPNAAAGMNPDAIADPKLRQQYKQAIADASAINQKNRQQDLLRDAREEITIMATGLLAASNKKGWSRNELMEHFAKDEASKGMMSKRLGKTEHQEDGDKK